LSELLIKKYFSKLSLFETIITVMGIEKLMVRIWNVYKNIVMIIIITIIINNRHKQISNSNDDRDAL